MKNKEFYGLIEDILASPDFRSLRHCRHHVRSNVYDHSLKVAYLCYRHHKRFGSRIPLAEFVRGALLHDFYLYDWHDDWPLHRWHLFAHADIALQNAVRAYPALTYVQRDMIRNHMFPVTPHRVPRTASGWWLCFYDKVAAISDYLGIKKV
ncbi:MAG: phosphohydrolase [Ruminococcaceae bacterium]|nr:phosphohydrolase [Oscillospiraceae bacterium]